ncbi:MAG: hypothetical protein G01um1014106_692, partial [Parcubacteria group bacterium Gr01-1014_106]
ELFTVPARESICRYFAKFAGPLQFTAASKPLRVDKFGYTCGFEAKAGAHFTDAHVWKCLVAEVISWPGGIGTLVDEVMDIVCVEGIEEILETFAKEPRDDDNEDPSQMPDRRESSPACFIEPFFTDLGRKLIREHHRIEYRGPMAETGPRDCDLWHMFIQKVRSASFKNDAAALGAFLVGPYAVLAAQTA